MPLGDRAVDALRAGTPVALKRRLANLGPRLLGIEDRRFERSLGIETAGGGSVAELTVVGGEASEGIGLTYEGQPVRLTRSWLRALPPDPDAYTFIDLGSAKGRVLFVAAERGFARVIGVEYVKELHDQAVANASTARRGENGPEIVPILGNAAEFEFPLDPLVVHFANPFAESVMAPVIANLTTSYERRPRPIVATYFQAWRERPERTTDNIELLAAATPFASHHTLSFPSAVDRLLLRQHRVEMYESREAIAARGT